MSTEETLTIDDYPVIIVYGSIEAERNGRVNVTEPLSNGSPQFFTAGKSNIRKVIFEAYIEQGSDLYSHLDSKVNLNETVTVKSSFNMIPSADYYLDGFNPVYENSKYCSAKLELTEFNGEQVNELYGESNKLTTNQALASDKKSVQSVTKTKSTTKTSFKTIKQGETNATIVKKIQKALKRNGYYLRALEGNKVYVDGVYGAVTTRSVREFQKAKGLKVTGQVDYETAKALGI